MAVLTKTATLAKTTLPQFLAKASNAQFNLKVAKIPSKIGDDLIRTVNAGFIVYGDWNVLTSDQFAKGIVKAGQANNQSNGGMVQTAGYLNANELLFRKLTTRSAANLKEYFLYTTFDLSNGWKSVPRDSAWPRKRPPELSLPPRLTRASARKRRNSIRTSGVRSSRTLALAPTGSAKALLRGGLLCQGDPLDQAARCDLRRIPSSLLRTWAWFDRGRKPNACRVAENHSLRSEPVPQKACHRHQDAEKS